jgi:hypothetical protein
MRSSPRRQRKAQLHLFHSPSKGPSWEKLPREIREQSVRLLARLLREHCARVLASKPGKEVRDE